MNKAIRKIKGKMAKSHNQPKQEIPCNTKSKHYQEQKELAAIAEALSTGGQRLFTTSQKR